MRRPYVVAFLVVLLAFFGLYYWRAQAAGRLDLTDHQEICEKLTAWALGQQQLRGNEQALIDFSFFSDKNVVLTFESCDPPTILPKLSEKQQINVVETDAVKAIHAERGFDDTVYIGIACLARGKYKTSYTVSIMFASLGGEGYDFEITKDTLGLKYSGKNSWIS